MNRSVIQRLGHEWDVFWAEPWLQALGIWLPPLLFALFWWIFSAGIATDLRIGVADLDHSQLSRSFIRQCDASPVMAVTAQYPSVLEGKRDLTAGNTYALAVIPADFEKNTLLGLAPQITVFYNGQFILIGKQINGAMQQVTGTMAARLGAGKALAQGLPLSALPGRLVPIRGQITPLFNKHSNYAEFLVSAGIPAVWQIFIVAITVLSLAAEKRHGGFSNWLDNSPGKALLAKFIPYTAIMWLQGILFLSTMYGWLGWPMHGSWFVLIGAQLLTILACQAMGAFFFLLSLDAARGLSLAAAYAAPGFAFMGVTFPATDMGLLAHIWRSILPVTHYIAIQINQANYGNDPGHSASSFAALCVFVLPLGVALLKLQRMVLPDKNSSGAAI